MIIQTKIQMASLIVGLRLMPPALMADVPKVAAQWSVEAAKRNAIQTVQEGKPFLYSSGGFVCSPKYRKQYQSIAKNLPIESLACGCVISGVTLRQTSYARDFNNQVLEQLEEIQNK
ncbi:MAG: hypothetical protein WCY88_12480 [Spongiibacteraceae bacterium]